MKRGMLFLGVASLAAGSALGAESEPTISVEAPALPQPDITTVSADEVHDTPADGGDFLRSLNGVSGIRFGGHGIDPVIRGQSQNRLNVLLDGAYVFGGCPNRMDPPSSYASLDSYDRVTVLRGNQSVIYGGGGSGGTVLFERYTQPFAPGEHYRTRFGGSYSGNGQAHDVFADVAGGGTQGYARAIVDDKSANNYVDGDGNEVRSAYKERSGTMLLGYTPDGDTRLELSADAVRGKDTLYIGGMDSPKSDADTVRLKFSKEGLGGTFDAFKAEVYGSDVDHLMDNYSLRDTTSQLMRVPSESVTRGGRVSGELQMAGGDWILGVDDQYSNRDATAYMAMNATTPFQSVWLLWPDVDISQAGIFAQGDYILSNVSRLRAGLRYDHVRAEANKADEAPQNTMMGKTPNQLYQSTYGVTADTRTENNVGALLRYERDFGLSGNMWYASLSRSVRTADATERYFARGNWVGNPALDPEVHQQAELGLAMARENWKLGASVYYDRVNDFILRDLAGAKTIYRNVDAMLTGTEIEGTRWWNHNWSSNMTIAYVYGQNTTNNTPLAQIPPLEGTVSLEYRAAVWSFAGRVRGAARQNRVDLESGQDLQKTPGYGVIDLFGGYQLTEAAELKFGVDNLLDRSYANHLTRANAFDGSTLQAYEPGRSVWVKATARF